MDRRDLLRTFVTGLALTVLTLGAATCGGGGRSVPFDDLAGDLQSAECDFAVICGFAPDRMTCLSSLRFDSTQFATMKTDIAAGTIVYDGQAAGACVDVFKNLRSCKQSVMGDVQQKLDATCGKVFTGTLPPGGACFFSDECANRGTCEDQTCSNTCCAGTCVARPAPIPLGGDCSSPLKNQDCIGGTVCAAKAGGGGICKVPLPGGARCTPYDRCVLPYHCGGSIDLVTGEGTCVAPPARGQTCDGSGECDDGLDYCDPSYVCTSRIAVNDACSGPEACIGYAACDGMTCVAIPGPDASCDPQGNNPCLLSLSCDATMRCSLPPPPSSCR